MNETVRRRQEPTRVAWELMAGLAAAALLVSTLLLPVGQGIATWLGGRGWLWPDGHGGVMSAVGGLLVGRPGRAVSGVPAAGLPSGGFVYFAIAVVEMLYWAAVVTGGAVWWRLTGVGVRDGMADRRETESVLGVSQLRAVRAVIRPDLFGAFRSAGSAGGS